MAWRSMTKALAIYEKSLKAPERAGESVEGGAQEPAEVRPDGLEGQPSHDEALGLSKEGRP